MSILRFEFFFSTPPDDVAICEWCFFFSTGVRNVHRTVVCSNYCAETSGGRAKAASPNETDHRRVILLTHFSHFGCARCAASRRHSPLVRSVVADARGLGQIREISALFFRGLRGRPREKERENLALTNQKRYCLNLDTSGGDYGIPFVVQHEL